MYISALKSVQGAHSYDYVGNERVKFQNLVEDALQSELLDENGNPIVFVQQVTIVSFSYPPEIEAFLKEVQEVQFKKQQAEEQNAVNLALQKAEQTAADTRFNVAQKDANTEEARADGERRAKQAIASADAYAIKAKAEAGDEGIRKVQDALASSSAAYLEYQKTEQWNGTVPNFMMGESGVVPFINITP
ncbi:MAG: hypothetical protein A2748_03010 [Candidatus Wildermuthbacteria bacterium RIFCSPHIGHO2_01_FULL_45_20]|uniref:Band 7 domain-containing protein n=1 Tax=Candidatus Wildermuthbacteria bacterium RIFCSPHIGHO2_02_FULL_45_25 TaxID=1802450 RepID=A0A1G2R683_9BACT|nr:MAG: hypothetical protein A2748_03010 [Candidatus Wildermuthbacteria bacterium RIFCSPHIGHO2_01_FULL_45_20]OHA67889.1 MAG: hypothetical protein A3C04_04405 [Candidatus Wildermuthbacteria bacterium RIFCSPHIGHO2_02_FULL_45_25]